MSNRISDSPVDSKGFSDNHVHKYPIHIHHLNLLRYSISLEEPNSHYFEVVIDILDIPSMSDRRHLHLVMPTWTPGSYLIREFSKNVLDLVAFDIDEDKALESRKISKNAWEVETSDAINVRVKYRIYAFELTVDTSYMDNLHAIINGASAFMYVEGMQDQESELTVIPPDNWHNIATGLEPKAINENGTWTFKVPNYDILVDSPIEVGNQKISSFDVQGIRHDISLFSRREFEDQKLVSDIKKIVESTIPVFGHVPYKRYLFLVDILGENMGGLEHLNSTHCIASMYRFEPTQEYEQMLSLFSHEFFHAWNVKRMRPFGLGPFNYTSETYTKSLWIAEGITSYYDDLLLRRAKIYSVGDYLDSLCTNINILKSLPGSKWQSAEESSFDTWIKHYRPNENAPNVQSSYYFQGAVVGWMLDMHIRKSTESTKSLDDALRTLYNDSYLKENRGYKDGELEKICFDLTGDRAVKEIFDSRVRGRNDVDYDNYLAYAGLKLTPKKKQDESGFLGVKVQQEGGKLSVATVLSDTPAQECGLVASDEIIAIDGLRMDSSKLSWYISNRNPGNPIQLLISRTGALLELSTEIVSKPILEYRIQKAAEASDAQKAVFKGWLAENWDSEIIYEDYAPSPSKRNLFDYV